VIGVFEMTWTAICRKEGQTSAICFSSSPDAEDALKNIKAVVQCDGFQVLALIKGDHTPSFYGVDSETDEIVS
jgi:hypothetical protein